MDGSESGEAAAKLLEPLQQVCGGIVAERFKVLAIHKLHILLARPQHGFT